MTNASPTPPPTGVQCSDDIFDIKLVGTQVPLRQDRVHLVPRRGPLCGPGCDAARLHAEGYLREAKSFSSPHGAENALSLRKNVDSPQCLSGPRSHRPCTDTIPKHVNPACRPIVRACVRGVRALAALSDTPATEPTSSITALLTRSTARGHGRTLWRTAPFDKRPRRAPTLGSASDRVRQSPESALTFKCSSAVKYDITRLRSLPRYPGAKRQPIALGLLWSRNTANATARPPLRSGSSPHNNRTKYVRIGPGRQTTTASAKTKPSDPPISQNVKQEILCEAPPN